MKEVWLLVVGAHVNGIADNKKMSVPNNRGDKVTEAEGNSGSGSAGVVVVVVASLEVDLRTSTGAGRRSCSRPISPSAAFGEEATPTSHRRPIDTSSTTIHSLSAQRPIPATGSCPASFLEYRG